MWERVGGVISILATAILGFTQLVAAPLDARLAIVGLAAVVATGFVLRGIKRRHAWSKARRRVLGALAATALAIACVAVLLFTLAYHAILVTQTGAGRSGTVVLHAARVPADVTFALSVSAPGERIAQFQAGYRQDTGGTSWGLEADRPTAKRIAIHQFAYPQTFGVDYDVALAYDHVAVRPVVSPVTWVDDAYCGRLVRWFWIVGGLLWVVGLVFSLR